MPNYELIRDERAAALADAALDDAITFIKNFYPDLAGILPQAEALIMALIQKNLAQLGSFASILIGLFGKKSVLELIELVEGMEWLQDIGEQAAVQAATDWVAGQPAGDEICEALVDLGLVYQVATPDPPQPDPGPDPGPDPAKDYDYTHAYVGQIDRAPMAFFGYQDQLVMSCIAQTLDHQAPVWSMGAEGRIKRCATLPGKNESGHYGFPFPDGQGINLVPESDGEPINFTASGPDGPFQRHSFKDLVPHPYKALKWGFGYLCPDAKRQFLGFGNAEHPGMLLEFRAGWKLFAAPGDMRFPNSMAVITGGPHDGDVLVCSSYGGSRVHLLDKVRGRVLASQAFPGWCVLRTHKQERYAIIGNGEGEVWWMDLDDGPLAMDYVPLGKPLEGDMGEPCIHPVSGRMIIPAINGHRTNIYEAARHDSGMHIRKVATIEGVGEWAAKTAVVGGQFYIGVGKHTGQKANQVPGVVYRITATEV
jgi:hypothetical protein